MFSVDLAKSAALTNETKGGRVGGRNQCREGRTNTANETDATNGTNATNANQCRAADFAK